VSLSATDASADLTTTPATASTSATNGEASFGSLLFTGVTSDDTLTATLVLNSSNTAINLTTQSTSFSVGQGTPMVTTWPTASAITYGQPLSASMLSGGVASVGGSFAFALPLTVPYAGTQSESVTFTPTSSNYSPVSSTVSVQVNKATPTVTWPTASAINFGQMLSASTLSGGSAVSPITSATVSGGFAFTSPTLEPPVKTAPQPVMFTPGDTTDYNAVTSTVSVTVNTASSMVTTWPTASAITYGQPLSASMLSGGVASVGGSFAFALPLTVPGAGTQSESVTFTPTSSNYSPVSSTVSVQVNKATPTVTWPTASAINFGQMLSASTLSGGSAVSPITSATVSGGFAFTSPTLEPPVGTAPQPVMFTPGDTTDYNAVTSTVSVTVNTASSMVTTWPTASAITYGQPLSASMLSGGVASVGGSFAFALPLTVPGAGTQSESVTFTPTSSNYSPVSSTVSVQVNKATPTVTWPTASAINSGQMLSASTLSGGSAVSPITAAVVGGSFAFTNPTLEPPAGTNPQPVMFTPGDTTDYNAVTSTVSVTVNGLTDKVTKWPKASAITYGQPLSDSTLSGGKASVSGTFTFTNPGMVPTAGTQSESVTFTPTNPAYETVNSTVSVEVYQGTPTVTWPTASAINPGRCSRLRR
jgi:hypothetical protein